MLKFLLSMSASADVLALASLEVGGADYTSYTPPIHPLYTPYTHPIYPLYTLYTPPIHPLYTPYTPPIHSLYTPNTNPIHPLHTPYTRAPRPRIVLRRNLTCHGRESVPETL